MGLVLSRKPEERITIGDDIVITVVETGRNRVKLDIDAPRETRVMRTEKIGVPRSQPGQSVSGQLASQRRPALRRVA
jgi:carbon storage regulator